MATISTATNEKVYGIAKWYGLNESPDGDTRLKMGEASKMINWKITRDGNLKRRPGMEFFAGLNAVYTISISEDVVLIADGLLATDKIPVYTSATAMAPAGTVTLVGMEGVVEGGTYKVDGATVTAGNLSGASPLVFSVADGSLSPVGTRNEMTMPELAEALAALNPGEYIYTRYNEMPYAMRNDSLVFDGKTYRLNGYIMSAAVSGSTAKPVEGLWSGIVAGKRRLLAACDGNLWNLYDPDTDSVTRSLITNIDTSLGVNFIPFDNKVYIQNGKEYYVWDGTTFSTVDGYIPIVAIAIGPQGSADAGELTGYYVNLLTNKRKVWLSPDGDTHKTFKLPEPAKSVVVTDLSSNQTIPATDYTFTANTDEITFTRTLTAAVNSIQVEYTVKTHEDDATIPDYRKQVIGMRFAEIYSGGTDAALFFYGDGSNKTLYTGMDYDGMPRADYFPDQYEVAVGDSNTPITSLIRHYSALICFKSDSTWALSYGTTELATGDLTTAVYVTPVNRDKGNDAPGQVRLVDNSPVSCSGSELYRWSSVSRYSSGISRDERNAHRISDKVQASVKLLDFKKCCMWDDNDGQEFYISDNGVTLVWNYATDSWYRYDGLNAAIMCNFQGDVIVGTTDGRVYRLTYDKDTDDGTPIKADWESGSMDFGASNMRKYSSMMWLGLKPDAGASVDVCVITDRKNTFKDKIVSADKAKVPGQPFAVRSKIKAKKFVFYKLLLSVSKKMPAVTITNVDFRVRQTGYSK